MANYASNGSRKGHQDRVSSQQAKQQRCEHCNKVGHNKDSCWQLHPGQVPDRLKGKKKGAKDEKDEDPIQHRSFFARKIAAAVVSAL